MVEIALHHAWATHPQVALGVALLGTVVLGLYPEALFSHAQAAASTLEGLSSNIALR